MHFPDYETRLRIERRRPAQPASFQNARQIYDFMGALAEEPSELMYQLLLDTKHRLQGVYMVSKGGVDACVVPPLEVYKAAFVSNSPAFALVHNHPSGAVEPSPEDEALTRRLAQGSELLGLQFLDSIIIGDGRYFSFYEAGLLGRKAEVS